MEKDLHHDLNRRMYKIMTTKYQISSTFKFSLCSWNFDRRNNTRPL